MQPDTRLGNLDIVAVDDGRFTGDLLSEHRSDLPKDEFKASLLGQYRKGKSK
jgi:hypothetical protein